MNTTLCGAFATAIRAAVPTLARRNQVYTFAAHACDWRLTTRDRRLEASIHRLAIGASELLRQGFLSFDARTQSLRTGCTLTLKIACAGEWLSQAPEEQMLAALGLDAEPCEAVGDPPRLRRAHGRCPTTLASVELEGLPHIGFTLKAVYTLRQALPADDEESQKNDAAPYTDRQVWLLHSDPINASSVVAQAQARGWHVNVFASTTEMAHRARLLRPGQAGPALLICFLRDANMVEATIALREQLPDAHAVAALGLGDELWNLPTLSRRFELACHPFGDDEWNHWGKLDRTRAAAANGTVSTHALPARPLVLVADDDAVTCAITGAMLEVLECDQIIASNGREAVELSRAHAPRLVLMDLEMPEMDGIEATRRLRDMQRAGDLPPLRIIACTGADGTARAERARAVGVDSVLLKPVRLRFLQNELRRWLTHQ